MATGQAAAAGYSPQLLRKYIEPTENAETSSDAVPNISKWILMVEHLRAGWNSLLSWLREVQAWGESGSGMVS
jgi:hypothetical protein